MSPSEAFKLIQIAERAAARMGMREGDAVDICQHRTAEVQWFHEMIAEGKYREIREWLNKLDRQQED